MELTRIVNDHLEAGFEATTVEGTRAEVARFGDYELIITRGEDGTGVLRVHNVRTNDFQTLEVPIQGAAHFVPNDRLGDAEYFPDLFQGFIDYLEEQGETQIAAGIASLYPNELETAEQKSARLRQRSAVRVPDVTVIPRPASPQRRRGLREILGL